VETVNQRAMKTLEEALAGVTPLPWLYDDQPFPQPVSDETSIKNGVFAIRAANAFPALVRFVESQPCRCNFDYTSGQIGDWNKCPRCAVLEKALA